MDKLLVPQPLPAPGTGDVWLDVLADTRCSDALRALMEERRAFGIAKHGTPVQVDNARNFEADAIQEILDCHPYTEGRAQQLERSGLTDGPYLAREWRRVRRNATALAEEMRELIEIGKRAR
jgi:hypothetical protein